MTIVSAEPDPPYNRPPLTKGFLRGEIERDGHTRRPPEDWDEEVVELRLETAVAAIDPDEHEVELAGGERVPYGTLVSQPARDRGQLPIPGGDLVGVHTYRTLADAEAVSRQPRTPTPRSSSAAASSAPRPRPHCACAGWRSTLVEMG